MAWYRVSSSSPRALSNDACYAIIDKTIAKPCPPKLSSYKLNTNKNKASGNSVQPICTVMRSIDSSFSELSSANFDQSQDIVDLLETVGGPGVCNINKKHGLYGAISAILY